MNKITWNGLSGRFRLGISISETNISDGLILSTRAEPSSII
ncbi:MAG: hypothetical protein V1709_07440 [Planctomycetota bacterium]